MGIDLAFLEMSVDRQVLFTIVLHHGYDWFGCLKSQKGIQVSGTPWQGLQYHQIKYDSTRHPSLENGIGN